MTLHRDWCLEDIIPAPKRPQKLALRSISSRRSSTNPGLPMEAEEIVFRILLFKIFKPERNLAFAR